MSHHSSDPMDEMGDKFRQQMEIEAQRQGLGATSRYPSGQIHNSDEGEIRIGVASDDKAGKVMLNFGKPVAWLAFNPEEAIEVAQALIQHARKVAKEPIAIRLN